MRVHLQDVLRAFRHRYTSRSVGDPIALSDLVASIYGEVMAHQDNRIGADSYRSAYRDRNPRPGEIVTEVDLAGEMWCYFTAHFFKFYQALVETAIPSSMDSISRSIFGCNRITILDIGSGIGTASLAAIDLLHEWQRFLFASGYSPARIDVIVQPVEVNPLKLPILRQILNAVGERVCPYFLRVQVLAPVIHPFPCDQCFEVIGRALGEGGPHLLVTLSNILTWIRGWKPSPQSRLRRFWNWILDKFTAPELPQYLVRTLELLNSLQFDYKTIAFVETDDRSLPREVDAAVHAVAARLPIVAANTSGPGNVFFSNPECSKWRQLGYATRRVQFHRGLCTAITPGFYGQELLHEALSPNNLRLAWAKTRHWEHTMFISDEVATKLFESDLLWKLQRFSQIAYSGIVQRLYSRWLLRYHSPKSEMANRPMSACTFEDQMLLIALGWVQQRGFEESFDSHGVASFGYRLNDQPDEFLYQHWFCCHQGFVRTVLRALRLWNGGYHQADITKFFDNIHQNRLADRLRADGCEREEGVHAIWSFHILSECWSGSASGRGILQGHAMSGFLANVYLRPFDAEMCGGHGFSGRYFRYVDDMIWIYQQRQRLETLPTSIVSSLSVQHDLTLNPEKVSSGTVDTFRRKIRDETLESLADRTHSVIRPVYSLGYDALHVFQRDKQAFVARYSELLQQVGIFVSPWHLLRKLQTQAAREGWLRRLFHFAKCVSLPEFPEVAHRELFVAWAKEFAARNTRWCMQRRQLSDELLNFCWGALLALEDGKADPEKQKTLLRRVRFSALRLSRFAEVLTRNVLRS